MQSRWRARLSARVALYLMLGVLLILLASLTAAGLRVAHANSAGGNMPVIHWDPGMIYAGQNNGNPWGPVGENTIVHGANFDPKMQLRLVISPGDSNSNPAVCQQTGITTQVATVTTDSTGSFTQNFPWPSAAGQVNQAYSICSRRVSNNTIVSNLDDGPFTVLSSSPPLITLSASSVAAGNSITVAGQYWVPPQPVSVIIASCADCGGAVLVANTGTTSAGLNSGLFSVSIPIPTTAIAGNYVVDALTTTGLDANYTSGVKHLAITAAPTTPPSPTPTLQPSPTLTPTAQASTTPVATVTTSGANGTVTATSNGSGGTTGTGTGTSSGSSTSGILFALICIAICFFMIAAIILIWLLLRRRLAGYTTQRPPYRSPSQAGRFGQSSPANYPPPFAQSSGIPIPAGNSTPPLPPPPQQGGTGGYPTYGQYGHQTGNQAQLLNSMPTEAYDAQRAYSMQQGNAQNAS